MAYEDVKEYFKSVGLEDRFFERELPSATVEQAAESVGCEPKQIAKTMSFIVDESPVLIVSAGDAKIHNSKFKAQFKQKAKMISGDKVEDLIGHAPGGVCPFAIKDGVAVYLDESLKRFDTVHAAGGSGNTTIELSIPELEQHSKAVGWVDVSKGWQEE